MKLIINGQTHRVDVEPDMPLLWVLRDVLGMTGTKFGCGKNQCGACTVLIDGEAERTCRLSVSTVEGEITTIEGIANGETLDAVQQAWVDLQVPQCGYCQSGQIVAAVALLKENPNPGDADIDEAMDNICRCGTYPRIRAAIHRAATLLEH